MLVLHIGPHKTATTYIQHNLFLSRDDLAQAGWSYPSIGMHELRAHHDLAHNPGEYLKPGGMYYDELAQTPATLGDIKNIILSAEGFCRWTPTQFRQLADMLGQGELKLVYVVRDPIALFYSYWTEEVKQGYTASLPQRFAENFGDPLNSRLVNPLVDLNPLLQMEDATLHVLLFESLRRQGEDIFSALTKNVCNLDDIRPKKVTRSNEGFLIELTEFLRLLTIHAANGEGHVGSQLRHAFIKGTTADERHEIVRILSVYAAHARRQVTIPRDTIILKTMEKQISQKLAGMAVPDFDEHSIFLSEAAILPYYDSSVLLGQPVVATLLDHYTNKLNLADFT